MSTQLSSVSSCLELWYDQGRQLRTAPTTLVSIRQFLRSACGDCSPLPRLPGATCGPNRSQSWASWSGRWTFRHCWGDGCPYRCPGRSRSCLRAVACPFEGQRALDSPPSWSVWLEDGRRGVSSGSCECPAASPSCPWLVFGASLFAYSSTWIETGCSRRIA